MPHHHKKKKKSMPHQNFTTIKIFHTSIHNYQIFSIAIKKNSYMSKIKIFPQVHAHAQINSYIAKIIILHF